MKKQHALAIAALLLCLAGCDKKVFYTDSHRVDEQGWNMNKKFTYDVTVDDTTRLYSFFVDVRLSDNYPYANAFFFIDTRFPDGGVAADTVECPVAYPDGQWMGRRTGGYIDNRYSFRKNMLFPTAGTYTFTLSHGMRDTNIIGFKNVGLRIEYAD